MPRREGESDSEPTARFDQGKVSDEARCEVASPELLINHRRADSGRIQFEVPKAALEGVVLNPDGTPAEHVLVEAPPPELSSVELESDHRLRDLRWGTPRDVTDARGGFGLQLHRAGCSVSVDRAVRRLKRVDETLVIYTSGAAVRVLTELDETQMEIAGALGLLQLAEQMGTTVLEQDQVTSAPSVTAIHVDDLP